MKYYAIQEKATGRFIAFTDFSRVDGKSQQVFVTPSRPPLLLPKGALGPEIKRRRIDPTRYRVVAVEIKTVEAER